MFRHEGHQWHQYLVRQLVVEGAPTCQDKQQPISRRILDFVVDHGEEQLFKGFRMAIQHL